ncbi:hypothetical protein [Streptomyces sp. NPDC001970]
MPDDMQPPRHLKFREPQLQLPLSLARNTHFAPPFTRHTTPHPCGSAQSATQACANSNTRERLIFSLNKAQHKENSSLYHLLSDSASGHPASGAGTTFSHLSNIWSFDVSERHLGFDTFDLVEQILVSHHLTRDGDVGRYRRGSSRHRYAWPAELDLMARIAGLELERRVADWDGAPFTQDSTKHISVWRKPA